MMASERIEKSLKELEEKKRNGDISSKEFYMGLIELLPIIKEELLKENITEDFAKKSSPFLLTFIKSMIREFRKRGN